MKDINVLKIKLARKRVLEFLNQMYPTPLELGTIFDTMGYFDFDYDFSLFKKDIAYFYDKGWIRFVDDRLGGSSEFRKKVATLTAEGKEIAEQTQVDPALEI